MTLLLGTDTVFDYLVGRKICLEGDRQSCQIEPKIFKNFNLLVQLAGDRYLLVKQESRNQTGYTNGDLWHEWQLHQFLQATPDLAPVQALISEALDGDEANSILVLRYLADYADLEGTGALSQAITPDVAAAVGMTLAAIHCATYRRDDYLTRLRKSVDYQAIDRVPNFSHGLDPITPEIFGQVTTDGLRFYELFQRHGELGRAIAHLSRSVIPCCLVHNDLKFSNILLYVGQPKDLPHTGRKPAIRLIDWERWRWGEPALDLGSLVAAYLKLWLKSLVVAPDLDVAASLRLATVPLEQVQPALVALMRGYGARFPQVLDAFASETEWLTRVMQFAGLALIESLQARLHYLEPFGNGEICLLQVAKTLLCSPEASVQTVFGMPATDLLTQPITVPR